MRGEGGGPPLPPPYPSSGTSVTLPEGFPSPPAARPPLSAAAPTAPYPSSPGPLSQAAGKPPPGHSAAAEAEVAVPRRPVEPYV